MSMLRRTISSLSSSLLRANSKCISTAAATNPLLLRTQQRNNQTQRQVQQQQRYLSTAIVSASPTNQAKESPKHGNRESGVAAVELTSDRYRHSVQRGYYSTLEAHDISFFTALLGKNGLITDSDDLVPYNVDWFKTVRGMGKLVLRPRTTEEVSGILKYCHDRNLAVCVSGGNTGISGGSVPVYDEIILSTSRMNQIFSVDDLSGVLVCQSGCILETLNEHVDKFGFVMPLDLGAKESCQIGGNVSTNAGGLRVLRYGNLHTTVLGLEVVLADGTVLDCMNTMKKDNTGYDLKHLFIGAEGTLGVVTKVAIQCPVKPSSTNLAFLGLPTFAAVLDTYKSAKVELTEVISACEYIDKASFDCVTRNLRLQIPIGSNFPFYMMIETSGSHASHDEEKLNAFLERRMADGTVTGGTVASQPSQIKALWSVRERLAEALTKDGYLYVYDFSIPIESFDELVLAARDFVAKTQLQQRADASHHSDNAHDTVRVTGFGHLGDSNIHVNVTMSEYDGGRISHELEPFLHEWVEGKRGSVSAEHGLGFKKRNLMRYSKSSQAIAKMKQIKLIFDPKNILNPYKVLPDSNGTHPSSSSHNHNSDESEYEQFS